MAGVVNNNVLNEFASIGSISFNASTLVLLNTAINAYLTATINLHKYIVALSYSNSNATNYNAILIFRNP